MRAHKSNGSARSLCSLCARLTGYGSVTAARGIAGQVAHPDQPLERRAQRAHRVQLALERQVARREWPTAAGRADAGGPQNASAGAARNALYASQSSPRSGSP